MKLRSDRVPRSAAAVVLLVGLLAAEHAPVGSGGRPLDDLVDRDDADARMVHVAGVPSRDAIRASVTDDAAGAVFSIATPDADGEMTATERRREDYREELDPREGSFRPTTRKRRGAGAAGGFADMVLADDHTGFADMVLAGSDDDAFDLDRRDLQVTPTMDPLATSAPTIDPLATNPPTAAPTSSPTTAPTMAPTASPSTSPTSSPTNPPTNPPTSPPTTAPTTTPTTTPTTAPTTVPTTAPTASTNPPTSAPTGSPTNRFPEATTAGPTAKSAKVQKSKKGKRGKSGAAADSKDSKEGKLALEEGDVAVKAVKRIREHVWNDGYRLSVAPPSESDGGRT